MTTELLSIFKCLPIKDRCKALAGYDGVPNLHKPGYNRDLAYWPTIGVEDGELMWRRGVRSQGCKESENGWRVFSDASRDGEYDNVLEQNS